MKSIPTEYNGANFRSRLEARWAAFFDLLHFKWEYEPFDLNGWIPDFLLIGECRILVEVKPITEFSQPVADKMLAGLSGSEDLADYLLQVGCIVPIAAGQTAPIGWLCHPQKSKWNLCALTYDDDDAKPGLFSKSKDIITGRAESIKFQHPNSAQFLWRKAGSYVQWRAA